MRLSMVIPVYKETDLESRAREIVSFWARFPVDLEVLWVIDPWKDFAFEKLESELKALAPPARIRFRPLLNPRRIGRGASVLRGLREAGGEVLAVGSLDFSIPLGEVFSALQEFVMARDKNFLLIGNRRGAKKKRSGRKTGLRAIFEDIEHEKSLGLQVKDPTCPFWMLKKNDWDSLGISKLRPWFYTPGVLQAARRQGLEIREFELNCRDNPGSRLGLWHAIR